MGEGKGRDVVWYRVEVAKQRNMHLVSQLHAINALIYLFGNERLHATNMIT